MTRFKREFHAWARRQGLWAWYVPRKAEDWAIAKVASCLADHVARQPETQQRIVDAVVHDILHNAGAARDDGIAKWIA